MFAQFSARLCELVLNSGYRFVASDAEEISLASQWVAFKAEPSIIVSLHLHDAEKIGLKKIIIYDMDWRAANAEKFLEDYKSAVDVHVLVGGTPEFPETDEYFGQELYSIFWHVNLDTKEITVAPGRPKKFFGIHEMISKAANTASGTPENAPENFTEISAKADALRPKIKHKKPILCYMLILINIAVFALTLRFEDVLYSGVIHAPIVVYGHEWHRLFTAMFLHFSLGHLLANGFGIIIFGMRLEMYLGRGIFVLTYIFAGFLGSIFSLVNLYFFGDPFVFTISAGASGAVFGIIGAIFAYSRITKHSLDMLNWYLLLIMIGVNLAMGFATQGIDNFAHIGGLVGGVSVGGIYGVIVKKRGVSV